MMKLLTALLLLLFFHHHWSQRVQLGHIRRRLSIVTETFTTVGAYNFTVPLNVLSLSVTLNGASGGPSQTTNYNALGGVGGSITANVPVTPGEVLQIRIGGQGLKAGAGGYNGGGASCQINSGGSGGGATDLRRSPYKRADRLVIAGGGGGSSSASNGAFPGGNGGYPNGGDSSTSTGSSGNFYGGFGGTQSTGGNGGNSCAGGTGDLGAGANCCVSAPGGAGGGGRYGGGAGSASGGGGGSSYAVTGIVSTDQAPVGDGQAIISYELTPTAEPTVPPTLNPSPTPSVRPTSQPSSQPSRQPSIQPTSQPSRQPSTQPSKQPLSLPTSQPSRQPTKQPVSLPSAQPSEQPTHQPTTQPSRQPSSQPSSQPTGQSAVQPSAQPSSQPSVIPTTQPSNQPTTFPTSQPTHNPSTQPSRQPSCRPSSQPTDQPTQQPTRQPSTQPTVQPSSQPSSRPSSLPSGHPNTVPSSQPSIQPSSFPTVQPNSSPSAQPSSPPSTQPSSSPSSQPSTPPSVQPTEIPTTQPSQRPSMQPSTQPTSIPTSQPVTKPTGQPTSQPIRTPTAQPSGQPSSFPTAQPSLSPTAHPSSCPSGQPTRMPTVRPSAQPSAQPSTQPSSQPYSDPTNQPTSQPSSHPSMQSSGQPQSLPSSVPTILPTVNNGEWSVLIQNTTGIHSVTQIGNETWVCNKVSYECSILVQSKIITADLVQRSTRYKFATGLVTSVFTTTDRRSVSISNTNPKPVTSNISKCLVSSSLLSCSTKAFDSANFTDATYNVAAEHILYVGRLGTTVTAAIMDTNIDAIRGYSYTTDKVSSIYLLRVTSLSGYFSSFVAGTCVDTTNSARNNIIAGRIRIDNGVMGAMIVKPQSGYFRNSAELVTSIIPYSSGPDLIIGGGMDLSSMPGLHGYIVRVNSVFRTFSYARRLRHRVENRRLSTQATSYGSTVRGIKLVGSSIYMIVDNTVLSATANGTSLSVLEMDATSGTIVNQVSISAPDSSIFCTGITPTIVGFTIACTLTAISMPHAAPALLLLSVDKELTFSKLPVGFVRSSESVFYTENIALTASDAQMSTVSTNIPTTSYQQTIVGQSLTLAPTRSPTARPTIVTTQSPTVSPTLIPSNSPTTYLSSSPSSQPSSSPTSNPTVSPQPTSHPSTAGPTNTHKPTLPPTVPPTVQPSTQPTAPPSPSPTVLPILQPTAHPSAQPSVVPTVSPTTQPSASPSRQPIPSTSCAPTSAVTSGPTLILSGGNNSHSNSFSDKSRGDNHIPEYVVGVCVVGAVASILGFCMCYHRYQAKQKDLVFSQVVPSNSAIGSNVADVKATCTKLPTARASEPHHNSIGSASFTLSSQYSDELSESEQGFSASSKSFHSGSFHSELRRSSSNGDFQSGEFSDGEDDDEMKSVGNSSEDNYHYESEGENSIHSGNDYSTE